MNRSTCESVAAARARWLAELAEAVEQAQRLSWLLGGAQSDNLEAMELYTRLECVRLEIEQLRRSGWARLREEFSPEWIDALLGQRGLSRSAS